MPVEIKELHIKVVVDQKENAGNSSNKTPVSTGNAPSGIDREVFIAECVEQILKIIRLKKER